VGATNPRIDCKLFSDLFGFDGVDNFSTLFLGI
jgi:hypothetical protein